MKKKYILTDESIIHKGKTLYRIKALKNFGDVKKGALGGFIESYNNLSQEGDCWVYDESMIYDKAKVLDNARIVWTSEIFGDSKVCGNTYISDTKIYDNAKIYDKASLWNSKIFGNSKIYGETSVSKCMISGKSEIYGSASVRSNLMSGFIKIYGNAKIYGKTKIDISGRDKRQINIGLNANITKDSDIYIPRMKCHLKGHITFFKDINNDICISLNWFKGTVNEFKKTIYSLSLKKPTINKYLNLIKKAESYINI